MAAVCLHSELTFSQADATVNLPYPGPATYIVHPGLVPSSICGAPVIPASTQQQFQKETTSDDAPNPE